MSPVPGVCSVPEQPRPPAHGVYPVPALSMSTVPGVHPVPEVYSAPGVTPTLITPAAPVEAGWDTPSSVLEGLGGAGNHLLGVS